MNNAETLRKLAFLEIVKEAEVPELRESALVIRKIGTSKGILAVSIDFQDVRHIVKINHDTCDVIGDSEICEESRAFRLTEHGFKLDYAARHKLQTGTPIIEYPIQ